MWRREGMGFSSIVLFLLWHVNYVVKPFEKYAIIGTCISKIIFTAPHKSFFEKPICNGLRGKVLLWNNRWELKYKNKWQAHVKKGSTDVAALVWFWEFVPFSIIISNCENKMNKEGMKHGRFLNFWKLKTTNFWPWMLVLWNGKWY